MQGAEFCVVVIPSTVQVDRSHYEFYRKATFVLDDRLAGSSTPQDRMKEFAAREQIRCIDLLPGFKTAPDTAALYWENDDHLSEMGHILAFKTLREQFLDEWTEAQDPASE